MKLIIDKNTRKVLFASMQKIELLENQMEIDFISTDGLIVPFVDLEKMTVYEGATPEELANYKKTLVPYEVPLWSMRNVLRKNQMFDDILTAINLLPETTKTDALDYLEYGNYIERNSNTVLLIQQIKGLNETEVDDLFIEANNLKL